MLAIVGGTVGYLWLSRAAKAPLPDATVDIWFTADPLRASGQNKIAALNAAADAFRTLYPNVELRLQSIASEQYEQQLKQAEQDGTLPVLFERTAQNAELACNAKAIRQLNRQISSEEFRLAAPVSGEYAALGYGLPVLYASNACAEGIGFDFRQATGATLTSLASLDLKAGMKASFLPAYEVLFQSSIPETDNMKVSADTLDAFLSGEQGLYYGDTADTADVQAQHLIFHGGQLLLQRAAQARNTLCGQKIVLRADGCTGMIQIVLQGNHIIRGNIFAPTEFSQRGLYCIFNTSAGKSAKSGASFRLVRTQGGQQTDHALLDQIVLLQRRVNVLHGNHLHSGAHGVDQCIYGSSAAA